MNTFLDFQTTEVSSINPKLKGRKGIWTSGLVGGGRDFLPGWGNQGVNPGMQVIQGESRKEIQNSISLPSCNKQ